MLLSSLLCVYDHRLHRTPSELHNKIINASPLLRWAELRSSCRALSSSQFLRKSICCAWDAISTIYIFVPYTFTWHVFRGNNVALLESIKLRVCHQSSCSLLAQMEAIRATTSRTTSPMLPHNATVSASNKHLYGTRYISASIYIVTVCEHRYKEHPHIARKSAICSADSWQAEYYTIFT